MKTLITILLAYFLYTATAFCQKRHVIKTIDTIAIGIQGIYKGWHYYKRYKRFWIAYPGPNAQPLKDIALPIRKGYFYPKP